MQDCVSGSWQLALMDAPGTSGTSSIHMPKPPPIRRIANPANAQTALRILPFSEKSAAI
jgi:hypothetical protein